jgi:hypothetical protein
MYLMARSLLPNPLGLSGVLGRISITCTQWALEAQRFGIRVVAIALAMASSVVPSRAGAQVAVPASPPASPTEAAATITAAELARHVAVLTADSLGGRPTPSPALEQTAQYVAAEFQRLGLRPGLIETYGTGRDSTWFQRYPLPGQHRFSYDSSRVRLRPRLQRQRVVVYFRDGVRFLPEVGPP